MDGLSITIGIGIVVFLMFYLGFNIEKEHKLLRLLIIFAGIFMLLLIPPITINLENECSILGNTTNNTYVCYTPNGTLVSPEDTNVGENFTLAYLWFIRIFVAYVFVYYGYSVLKWLISTVPRAKRRYG